MKTRKNYLPGKSISDGNNGRKEPGEISPGNTLKNICLTWQIELTQS